MSSDRGSINSYIYSNLQRGASFILMLVISRRLIGDDLADIFMYKNVSNGIVLLGSFGLHISQLRSGSISMFYGSMSIVRIILILEVLGITFGFLNYSILYFTLTTYYALVFPSMPEQKLRNVLGISVGTIVTAVVVFTDFRINLTLSIASCVLIAPLIGRIYVKYIKSLFNNNLGLFVGELPPFIFGLLFVPLMLIYRGSEFVNIYGRLMLFVNLMLFPVNGLKYVLLSRLRRGATLGNLKFIYPVFALISFILVNLFKDKLGQENAAVLTDFMLIIILLLTSRVGAEIFQQKSYILSSDTKRNIVISLGYVLRLLTLFSPSIDLFLMLFVGVEVLILMLFYVLDFFNSNNPYIS